MMNTLIPKQFIFFILLALFSIGNSHSANAPWVGQDLKGAPCKGKTTTYGPYDYKLKAQKARELYLVESAHFTNNVENLAKGNSGSLPRELDYTLRAWPNHHRALNSISRYKLLYPNGKKTISAVECYFQRAINFSPEDATTHMLYGMFLHKTKHLKAAKIAYDAAVKLSPLNPVVRYNYGLFLFQLKKYDLAQKQAVIAYEANFPLNGLKNKLKRVKFWPPKQVVNTGDNNIITPKNAIKQ